MKAIAAYFESSENVERFVVQVGTFAGVTGLLTCATCLIDLLTR
ncbi:hypothetical protein B0G83_105222 [Paraburkholderia sp. BL21I4N1]|nr:hypothetical protein B0G83_105222 [Paraburkholderia sp. BL21I4N1]